MGAGIQPPPLLFPAVSWDKRSLLTPPTTDRLRRPTSAVRPSRSVGGPGPRDTCCQPLAELNGQGIRSAGSRMNDFSLCKGKDAVIKSALHLFFDKLRTLCSFRISLQFERHALKIFFSIFPNVTLGFLAAACERRRVFTWLFPTIPKSFWESLLPGWCPCPFCVACALCF